MRSFRFSALCLTTIVSAASAGAQQRAALPTARLDGFKREAIADVDSRAKFTQQMVDQIFSFGELGFQEVETSKYIVKILRDNGFTVEEGVAGMPTAWVATWGSGKPVDRHRLGHRRHPASVAEAGRRLSRADRSRCAWPR